MPRKWTPVIDRLLAKVEMVGECWIYRGASTPGGYGQLTSGGHAGPRVYAHRVSHEHYIGPIPAGYEVDHLCQKSLCVNPAHLEAVTPAENRRRVTERRTHCPQGHPYTIENSYFTGTWRRCKTCTRARSAAYKQRKRLEEAS